MDDVGLESSDRSAAPLLVAPLSVESFLGDDSGRFVDGELLLAAKSLSAGCWIWFRFESKGFDSSFGGLDD